MLTLCFYTTNCVLFIQTPDGKFVQGFNTLRLLNLEDNNIDSWDEIVKLSYLKSLEQLHLNKNRIKHVKYPFILPTHGPLDDASAVPFENLQVLLLGMPVVGLFLLLLHKILALFYLTYVLH